MDKLNWFAIGCMENEISSNWKKELIDRWKKGSDFWCFRTEDEYDLVWAITLIKIFEKSIVFDLFHSPIGN